MVTRYDDALYSSATNPLEKAKYQTFRFRRRCAAVKDVARYEEDVDFFMLDKIAEMLEDIAEFCQTVDILPDTSRVPIAGEERPRSLPLQNVSGSAQMSAPDNDLISKKPALFTLPRVPVR